MYVKYFHKRAVSSESTLSVSIEIALYSKHEIGPEIAARKKTLQQN